jgi:hypothetical protein
MSFRAACAVALLTFTACEGEVELGPERTREGVFVYAAPMAAGRTLALRNMSGTLTVEPATDDTLRVVADVRWHGDSTLPRDLSFRGDTMAGGVLVCAMVGDGTCTPDDYEVNSDGSGFSIGRGRVRLGLGGSTQARVHFRAQVPAGVRLDLVMIDGSIQSASSAPVKARGVNGSITVVTSVGPVQAKTVNGDVDVRMTTLSGVDSVLVETVNGSASAYLSENVSAAVDVRVTNGSAISDFPGLSGGSQRISKTISGTLGAGGTAVRVRSLNGDAQLRRLDAAGLPFPLASAAPQ